MFFKYIDKYTIEIAPNPLVIEDRHYFTNDERLYNENGYYKLAYIDYPLDGKEYKPYYIQTGDRIIQGWERIIKDEPLSDYLESLQEE